MVKGWWRVRYVNLTRGDVSWRNITVCLLLDIGWTYQTHDRVVLKIDQHEHFPAISDIRISKNSPTLAWNPTRSTWPPRSWWYPWQRKTVGCLQWTPSKRSVQEWSVKCKNRTVRWKDWPLVHRKCVQRTRGSYWWSRNWSGWNFSEISCTEGDVTLATILRGTDTLVWK